MCCDGVCRRFSRATLGKQSRKHPDVSFEAHYGMIQDFFDRAEVVQETRNGYTRHLLFLMKYAVAAAAAAEDLPDDTDRGDDEDGGRVGQIDPIPAGVPYWYKVCPQLIFPLGDTIWHDSLLARARDGKRGGRGEDLLSTT